MKKRHHGYSKVHNSLATDSKDIEVSGISDKELKMMILKKINSRRIQKKIKEDNAGYE
jgi:hypothetical protein